MDSMNYFRGLEKKNKREMRGVYPPLGGHGMFACRRLDIVVVVVVLITGSCCIGAAAAAATPELRNSIFPLP
jgi:hypothetical protein